MLKLIYQRPGITRKDVGDTLCIDRAMVTHIFNYLVSNNWVVSQESTAKRLPLVLNKDRIYAAGIELQPESQVITVANLSGELVFTKSFSDNIEDINGFLTQKALPVLAGSGYKLAGIGIAVPGIVRQTDNTILRSVPFTQSEALQLPESYEINGEEIPVFIDNDVRCWGWGKVAFEKERDDFLVVIQHYIEDKNDADSFSRISGGASIFINGNPWRGAHGCAGELPVFFRLEEFGPKGLHIPYDKKLRMKNDPETKNGVFKNAAMIVSYIATVCDVKKVYLSGFEVFDSIDLHRQLQTYLAQYRFYPDFQSTDIFIQKSRSSDTARGAAGFVFEELIVRPTENEELESRLIVRK